MQVLSLDFDDGSMVDAQGRGFVDVTPGTSQARPYVYGGVLHLPPGTTVKTQGNEFFTGGSRPDPTPNLELPAEPGQTYLLEAGIRLPWSNYNVGSFWIHKKLTTYGDQPDMDEFDIIESFGPDHKVWTNVYWDWPHHPKNYQHELDMSDWNRYFWNKVSGIYRVGTSEAYMWVGSNWQAETFPNLPLPGGRFDNPEIVVLSNKFKPGQTGTVTDPASFMLVDWVRIYKCSDTSGCWGRSPN